DGRHRAFGRCARRGGLRVSFWQDVPRLESLWDRRLRGRRPPRHAVPLARIYRGDEHCVDATPPVRVDTVILRAAGGDGTFHAPCTAALSIHSTMTFRWLIASLHDLPAEASPN